ncbi:N-acetylneuraminate synthase family protein [Candidatus Pseudothioglobus singularis]|nr:N-acetylneuraminate synthase family protein [Candidatus Pseudothioglobus singularis]
MIISKEISPYVVYSGDSVEYSLEKINLNNRKIVYSLSENGVLQGSATDGDVRRWILKTNQINLQESIGSLANQDVISVNQSVTPQQIELMFTPEASSIPIVDEFNRLVAIAWKDDGVFSIGGRKISDDSPSFIIAEIGNNHNGSIDLAKKLVDAAAEASADCVKFQLRDMDTLYKERGKVNSEDLGSEYTLDLLSRTQLSLDEMFEVFDYAKQCELIPLCTPWDLVSLERLNNYGIQGIKISSADLTNHILLEAAANTKLPLLVSTGMSREHEIQESISLLNKKHTPFALLHCNSTYPTPMSDINLSYMDRLKNISHRLVGYSGHERGYEVCIAAVARGARVIEKHFTLDRSMEGNDHRVSLLPKEFSEMVRLIRNVEEALGTSDDRIISQGESLNREVLAKSIVASVDISKNKIITEDMLDIRSPGRGLQPSRIKDLIGLPAYRNIKSEDIFFESDIVGDKHQPREFDFDRPWGIPVRYHDFESLLRDNPVDFVELHLSYRDLEMDPSEYIELQKNISFVVHSPELFARDHLMDLSSLDEAYRNKSIDELKRVIEHTHKIKELFASDFQPLVIINAGGFTLEKFMLEDERWPRYERIGEALSVIDTGKIEIIPQTMPPFPWHFGGQRFHNLFVNPEEIVRFCENFDSRICYDISHSKLACNFYDWSLQEFTKTVSPYIAHLHVVDARGFYDEGLQIGDGEVDFDALGNDLRKWAPKIPFIPEIWQGHKNDGEAFWIALDKLERKFALK